jgi:hypothetical protein
VQTDALFIAPIILAVVLAVSAVGKLRGPAASSEAFRDLRVPTPLARPLVITSLPWAELLLALLLVVAGGWLGIVASVGALALFTAYLLLVARALGFEESVDCACFGEFAPGRITRRTIVRNAWLLVLAGVALAAAIMGPSPWSLLAGSTTALSTVAAAVAAALTTYLVAGQSGARGEAATAPSDDAEDLEDYLRAPIPALPVTLADGTESDLRTLSGERAQLLLFVSEICGSCEDIIAAAPGWREAMPQIDVRLVVSVAPEMSALTSSQEPLSLHDLAHRLPPSFGFRATPSALLLGADGFLAGGPVTGSVAVPDFVEEIVAQLSAEAVEP